MPRAIRTSTRFAGARHISTRTLHCNLRPHGRPHTAGGGEGPPPAHRGCTADDPGSPKRGSQAHLRFAMITVALVFAEKFRRFCCLVRTPATLEMHKLRSEHVDQVDIDHIASIRRILRDLMADQVAMKKELHRSRRLHSTMGFVCTMPVLQSDALNGMSDECSRSILLRHCLDVRWPWASRSCGNDVQCLAPEACLHTHAVADLDHGILLTGRTILSAHGFSLGQMQFRKKFSECLHLVVSPIGLGFYELAHEHLHGSGDVLPVHASCCSTHAS